MTTRSGQSVAEQIRADEAQRVAIQAGRATIGNTWIAFAALMISLVIIIGGGIFGYAQLIDQVKGTAKDTAELKTQMYTMSATVNLMAGRMGVQPQKPVSFETRLTPDTQFTLPFLSCAPMPTEEATGATFFTRLRW